MSGAADRLDPEGPAPFGWVRRADGLPDPRQHPWRTDLAAAGLEGLVPSARFVAPTRHQVSAGVAPLRAAPAGDAEQWSQALFGEMVDIFDEREGFGWGQMLSDGYVGWFDMAALSMPADAPNARVRALRTYAFSAPSVKAAPFFLLSLGARVARTGRVEAGFAECARGIWVAERHLAHLDEIEPDAVAVAERFAGAPYQWGGVESLGLDCSGLIQTAFKAAGRLPPRDSDLMRAWGKAVPDGARLQRGDIVCWQGHVGLMTGPATMIHANAYHMETAIEPLAEAVARYSAAGLETLCMRRAG